MNKELVISVRFHDGRYHGAGDWPPAPARLFQALVAGAGLGGPLDKDARKALGWLEKLRNPVIAAPAAKRGRGVLFYMPNNDSDRIEGDPLRVAKIRTARKVFTPYLFDAGTPFIYAWPLENAPEGERYASLVCSLADQLYQLGRGVDMAWAWGEMIETEDLKTRLCVYPGRIYRPSAGRSTSPLACPRPRSLDSIDKRYKAYGERFRVLREGKAPGVEFRQAPRPRFRSVPYDSPPVRLIYELHEATPKVPFGAWPQERVAQLVVSLRDAALKRLTDALPQKVALIERVLIGRNATEADKALRVRILPLPSIGHEHVARSIRRVLIELPPDCPIGTDDIAWAFSASPVGEGTVDKETGEIIGETRLVRTSEHGMLAHYGIETNAAYRLWRTVTPAALPEFTARRRIKSSRRLEDMKGAHERLVEENRAAVATLQALRHVGTNTRVATVRVQREPFSARGARAEAFSPATRFAKERLWHIEISFAEPIQGPLIIGDGRYMGLGLMAPVQRVEGAWAFAVKSGLTKDAEPETLARALRRAVMARVQDTLGPRNSLPTFFTGHELDGAPARNGIHAHVAYVADMLRRRLLILAPHVLEERLPTREERNHQYTLDSALEGLAELRAGDAGFLKLAPLLIDTQEDLLFASSNRWESQTAYRPTRYAKGMSAAEVIAIDVQSELRRRSFAAPEKVEVLAAREGPHGGLVGRVRLTFRTAVSGPLLLGRTCHFGGGLFAAIE